MKKMILILGCAALFAGCSTLAALCGARDPFAPRTLAGTWCSLGTSITWYDAHVSNARGRFTTAYQTYVRKTLTFKDFINRGVNGGTVRSQLGKVSKADYYTIEHGINDWGQRTRVGTFADYLNNTSNNTFYANYRRLIDEIRAQNPKAVIIPCTPRRAYGFGTYLPASWNLPKNGIYLHEYADAVRAIARHEGFRVADFYANCGDNDQILRETCIDVALHPNDRGHRMMADELLRVFATVD